jgi:hypothetical protein
MSATDTRPRKDFSHHLHLNLRFTGQLGRVEALRSIYERLELRLWGLLPTRTRQRLATYGLAELRPEHPLNDPAQWRGSRGNG